MVKYIVGIYLLIGIVLAPLMRSNDLMAYRGHDKYHSIGESLPAVLFWPSYVFSIEPEIDAGPDSFDQSLLKVLKFRDEKMFSSFGRGKSYENLVLVYDALGACFLAEGAAINKISPEIIQKILKGSAQDFEMMQIKFKVEKRFDKHDFADIYHEGQKCQEEYKSKSTMSKITAPVKLEPPVATSPSTEPSAPARTDGLGSTAVMDMDVGYGLKWRDVVNSPKAYIDNCTRLSIEIAMKQGGYTEQAARQWLGDSCEKELEKLSQCMKGESPSAEKCTPEYDG